MFYHENRGEYQDVYAFETNLDLRLNRGLFLKKIEQTSLTKQTSRASNMYNCAQ